MPSNEFNNEINEIEIVNLQETDRRGGMNRLNTLTPNEYRNVFSSHVFNIGTTFIDESQETTHISKAIIDSAHLNRLVTATNLVLSDFQTYQDPERRDSRENNYLEIIKNEKRESITTMDLITSEFPIYLAELSRAEIQGIYDSGSVRGAVSVEGGKKAVCVKCSLDTPFRFAFLTNSRIYCADHVPHFKMCGACNELKEDAKLVTTFDEREIYVCKGCIENRMANGCRRCGSPFSLEYVELRRCPNHLGEEGQGMRGFSKSLKWVVRQKGEVVKSTRMFSAEIEALVGKSRAIEVLAATIPPECGMTGDGSVSGMSLHGFEMQTPRLAGRKGEELLWRVGASLKKVDATVNSTCGMHIHLDGKGLINPNRRIYPKALIQLWKAYIVFEDVVLSVIPYERRSTSYARPLRDVFKLIELEVCETMLDCERLWYKERYWHNIQSYKLDRHHTTRYFGVNLHPLLGHGHMEIRYHSGTTNPNKILQWVNLHALIMDAAAEGKFTREFLKEAQATTALKDKTDLLFDLLGMAEGSKQYFYARQKKFTKNTNNESHIA